MKQQNKLLPALNCTFPAGVTVPLMNQLHVRGMPAYTGDRFRFSSSWWR